MVIGFELFQEKFQDYTDCYTVIGGVACDISMTEADMNFKATKIVSVASKNEKFDVMLAFSNESCYCWRRVKIIKN